MGFRQQKTYAGLSIAEDFGKPNIIFLQETILGSICIDDTNDVID